MQNFSFGGIDPRISCRYVSDINVTNILLSCVLNVNFLYKNFGCIMLVLFDPMYLAFSFVLL